MLKTGQRTYHILSWPNLADKIWYARRMGISFYYILFFIFLITVFQIKPRISNSLCVPQNSSVGDYIQDRVSETSCQSQDVRSFCTPT